MHQISSDFERELSKLKEQGKLSQGDTVYVCFSGDKAVPERYDSHTEKGLNLFNYAKDVAWAEIKYLQLKRDDHVAHSVATDEGMPDPRD